ncbi:MAG: hypothetical protein LBI95_01960 [Holosporales bacterium]|nr:hypothetical protein [Holosporales bacterium]
MFIFSLLLLVFVGVFVSVIKYEVVFLRNSLKEVNEKIERYSDDLAVYEAEWSYLNDPKRLKFLCEKYLKNLRPTENRQILSYDLFLKSDVKRNFTGNFRTFLDEVLEKDEGKNR